MKYRLKKDLPFAKAGSEVGLRASTANWVVYPDSKRRDLCYFIGYNYNEGDLFDAGWIEEIKPREFELYFDTCGDLEKVFCDGKKIKIDHRKQAVSKPVYSEIIKATEVLE